MLTHSQSVSCKSVPCIGGGVSIITKTHCVYTMYETFYRKNLMCRIGRHFFVWCVEFSRKITIFEISTLYMNTLLSRKDSVLCFYLHFLSFLLIHPWPTESWLRHRERCPSTVVITLHFRYIFYNWIQFFKTLNITLLEYFIYLYRIF